MNGGRRNDEKDKEAEEGGGGGWASTFLKVAGAVATAAAVAGSLYGALKQAEGNMAPFQVQTDQTVILNVDGSLLPESAGCGGVLTDVSGNWISGFAQRLNPNLKVDETEKEAILSGLIWVKEKGKRKVVVKSDNEGVVNFVNSGVRSNDDYVRRIRGLLNSPEWQATLVLISRNANGVADKLAHQAHELTSFDLCQFDYPPQNCVSSFLIK